jgi:hypothetical protein
MTKIFPVNRCNDCPHFETFVKDDEFLQVCRFQGDVEFIRHDFDNDSVPIPDWCKLSDMPRPRKPLSESILTVHDTERAIELRDEITHRRGFNPLLKGLELFLTELIDGAKND